MFTPAVVDPSQRRRRDPAPIGVAGWRIELTTPLGIARVFVEAPCSREGAERFGWAFFNHELASEVRVEPCPAPPWDGVTQSELWLTDALCRRLPQLCSAPTRCLHTRVPVVERDEGRAEMIAVAESLGVRIVDE